MSDSVLMIARLTSLSWVMDVRRRTYLLTYVMSNEGEEELLGICGELMGEIEPGMLAISP